MSVRQLPETLHILFFDATPLLRIREHRSMMRVDRGQPTCSQSAICVFNWLTCFMRPLRTSTAWFGERLCYTLGESGVARLRGSLAAHQHCRVFLSLQLHNGDCGDERTVLRGHRGFSMNAPKNTAPASSWSVVRTSFKARGTQ